MRQDGIPHAGLAPDTEFFRRVHLDLTGRLPEPDAIREFFADPDPAKRDKTIDQILASPYLYKIEKTKTPFLDRWVYFFGDLFKSCTSQLRIGRNLFHDYLYLSFLTHVPYDEMVREMLTAKTRSNWFDGPANFLIRQYVEDDSSTDRMNDEDTYDEIAITSTKLFLGINLECVSCHDGKRHLENINPWLAGLKRERMWQQAAFFTQAKLHKPYQIDQEFSLLDKGKGYYDTSRSSVLRIGRYKADAAPQFLLTGERPRPGEGWREAYARMVTSHPQFARATVNLIWAELMGVGIVDPPLEFDMLRQDPSHPPPSPWTIQPTHPELLDALAKDFVEHNYDFRHIIGVIAASSTYQLSSHFDGPWKESYSRYFARRFVRRLPAEMICDVISQATGVFETIPVWRSDQKVTRVMQTRSYEDLGGKELQPMREFLIQFGQSNRDKGERDFTGNSVQAAELLNGTFAKERVRIREGGRLHAMLNRKPAMAAAGMAEEMFLAFLARMPGAAEKALAVKLIEERGPQGLQDLAWVLLNRTEFIHNY